MAFYADDFIFDGIPSEEYGLIITSQDGESSTNASGHVELITEEIYRRHTPYFYGVRTSNVLKIPVSIRTTETEITAEDAAFIQRWLFGQLNYKELRIVQPDMDGMYYKCFFVDPAIIRVGNIIRGFEADILCDSPFAYQEEETVTIQTPSTSTLTLVNKSDDNYYTYPIVTIEVESDPQDTYNYAKITNTSDNNRVFQLGSTTSQLNSSEYVVINNDLQSIVSYTNSTMGTLTSENRISYLQNGYFFRLVPGINNLVFDCQSIDSLTISYTPLRRIS